jgi:lipoyl(octanoyl) transferase
MADLWVANLGRLPYATAVELQDRIRAARQAGAVPDSLLLLEHDPVYTKGRRTERADLPMGDDWYRLQGIEVAETSRGGRVTYHGPGQLVGYPIVGVTDVIEYVRTLERAVIAALADEGVEATVREGLTGI